MTSDLLPNYLKERRKGRGLTLQQVGDVAGVAAETVRGWESGQKMSVEHLRRVRRLLRLGNIDRLLVRMDRECER